MEVRNDCCVVLAKPLLMMVITNTRRISGFRVSILLPPLSFVVRKSKVLSWICSYAAVVWW
jgi:hypothetical protein